ncbi:MAG: response regulator [Candidatus Taylorbacteria bacterium]|nr:response regulator [Candidatus Taylorbacteria bacterium]
MRILIVEDKHNHQADARKFFKERYPDIQLLWAETQDEAMKILDPSSSGPHEFPDGVISDIFFPYGNWAPFTGIEPCGVAVMIVCKGKNIPCILNTDGNHHGARYQWVHDLTLRLGGPTMVDTFTEDKEKPTKNWERAFDELKKVIKAKMAAG